MREVFVPLVHPPGHAQVDFGEAFGVIGGIKRKLHYFAMALPHSDALFIKAYPAETRVVSLDRATWKSATMHCPPTPSPR